MSALSLAMPDAPTLIDWLWQTTWQTSALIALVFAATALLGRWLSPGWRYALWGVVALRLMMPALPSSPTSVFNVLDLPRPASTEAATPTGAVASAEATEPGALAPGEARLSSPAMRGDAAPAAGSAAASAAWSAEATARALIACWLIGAVLLLGWAAACNARFARRVRRTGVEADDQLQGMLRACCDTMGVRRAPRLVITDAVAGPALAGVRRPMLLLPPDVVARLEADELSHVLRHELAHLRRRDLPAHWLIVALRALHWFNPLVWVAARYVQAERELACDALVLSRGGSDDAPAYGRTLLKVIELMQNRPGANVALGIGGSARKLKRRMVMLRTNHRRGGFIGVMLAGVLACIGLTKAVEPETKGAAAGPADAAQAGTKDGAEDGPVVIEAEGGVRIMMRHGNTTLTAKRVSLTADAGGKDGAGVHFLPDAVDRITVRADAGEPREVTAIPGLIITDIKQAPKWLLEPVTMAFDQVPLTGVIDSLRQLSGRNIVVQWPHLAEKAGVAKQTPVTMSVQNVPLATALRLICESLGHAGYRIDDGVIVITATVQPQPRRDDLAEARNAKTRAALRQPIMASFEGSTLEAVLESVRKITGASLMVHWKSLNEDCGISREMPVTLQMKNVPVGTMLRLVLDQVNRNENHHAAYRVEDGVVVISSVPKP